MTERQEQKLKAIELVKLHYADLQGKLLGIDGRLLMYYQGLIDYSSPDPDDPEDYHSLWELLAALKLLSQPAGSLCATGCSPSSAVAARICAEASAVNCRA